MVEVPPPPPPSTEEEKRYRARKLQSWRHSFCRGSAGSFDHWHDFSDLGMVKIEAEPVPGFEVSCRVGRMAVDQF